MDDNIPDVQTEDDIVDEPIIEEILPLFAGRERAFSHLQHHLSNPTNTGAVTFLGRRLIGKTSLLKQLAADPSQPLIGVYVSMRQAPLDDELAWLNSLADSLLNAVQAAGYNPRSVDDPPTEVVALREWIKEQLLPSLFKAIRKQRLLALLLDDVELLMHASSATGELAMRQDAFAYLHSLLHAQLGIAVSIDLAYEDELDMFYPLLDPAGVYRLSRLPEETSSVLLQGAAGNTHTITEDTISAIHRASGGEPFLLQHFVSHLDDLGEDTINTKTIKAITSAVHTESVDEFQLIWDILNQNEQFVLTALGNLLYKDPLKSVDAAAIEAWLVKTDYPMDDTTISAAIRGLEYKDLVAGRASSVSITSGLMQKWLLENADINAIQTDMPKEVVNKRLAWLFIVVIVAMIMGLVLISQFDAPDNTQENTPVPTAPISSSEG